MRQHDDRDAPDNTATDRRAGGVDVWLWLSRFTNGVVRAAGVALVLVGLWAGVKVVFEAWSLYRDPTAVDRLARVIDRASHVDSLIPAPAAAPPAGNPAGRPAAPADERFRPSYFLAWVVAILLLLLVGKLASWTIRAGGQLAIHPAAPRSLA
jgi:hypothetical protein